MTSGRDRTTSGPATDRNREAFGASGTVGHYRDQTELTAGEEATFGVHLRPGMRILDLGVGAGRTTPYLSGLASHYLGIDFAPPMIDACRVRFPQLAFQVGDASSLAVSDAAFDAVVFSFNGLDYLHPVSRRRTALAEIRRVLRPGGVFLFSTHNARFLWLPPKPIGPRFRLTWLFSPTYRRGLAGTFRHLARALRSAATWSGQGYLLDPIHGGIVTHVVARSTMADAAADAAFEELQVLPATYPDLRKPWRIPWYYYAWRRPA